MWAFKVFNISTEVYNNNNQYGIYFQSLIKIDLSISISQYYWVGLLILQFYLSSFDWPQLWKLVSKLKIEIIESDATASFIPHTPIIIISVLLINSRNLHNLLLARKKVGKGLVSHLIKKIVRNTLEAARTIDLKSFIMLSKGS